MHLIYLIHEFHNLSLITEINELFHDILIYWDAPVHSRFSQTGLLLGRHFIPRDAERNELWLVVWNVGQTASWAGLGQWMGVIYSRPSAVSLNWRSGYATLHGYNG